MTAARSHTATCATLPLSRWVSRTARPPKKQTANKAWPLGKL